MTRGFGKMRTVIITCIVTLIIVIGVIFMAYLNGVFEVHNAKDYMLDKVGVAPYVLSQHENDFLRRLGVNTLTSNYDMVLFRGPEGAQTMSISVYQLNANGQWDKTGESGISSGGDERFMPLAGTIGMTQLKDYRIKMSVTSQGQFEYTSDLPELDQEMMVSAHQALSQYKRMVLDEEVPIAIYIRDSGNSMMSLDPDVYNHPEALKDYDLVQAVVIYFTEDDL